MKSRIFFLSAIVLFVAACSRGSHQQVIKKTPPFRFVKATLSNQISEEEGIPSIETTNFSAQDPHVIAHTEFENLFGIHTIRWDWYAPNGKLYTSSGDYYLKTKEGTYCQKASSWHKLSIKRDQATDLPGDWLVKIYLDKELITSKDFVIEEDVDNLPTASAEEDPNKWGLIIGIEEYANLPMVEYARDDARVMKEYFMRVFGVPEENIILLLDKEATRAQMEAYLQAYLPKNVTEDTLLYVYFAGHGAPELKDNHIHSYLIPHDGDVRFITQTGYSLKSFYEDLDKLMIKKAYVFLDACFSGNAARGNKTLLAAAMRPSLIHMEDIQLLSDKVISISASTEGQISSSYTEKGHGLFTYFLLNGLKGEADTSEDSWISVEEIYQYVRDNVTKVSRRKGMEQIPLVAPSFNSFKEMKDLKISKVLK